MSLAQDRAALFIVQDALKRSSFLKEEPLLRERRKHRDRIAVVCKEYDLKLKIVIPNTQSTEKKKL